MSAQTGRLITIEGIEGVGKSTAIKAVHSALMSKGLSAMLTHEPGGTPLAQKIRDLVLSDYEEYMTPITELLLMFAAREQHIKQRVEPALKRGEWVISDRYTDASFAYQGGGRGIPKERIDTLADWVQGAVLPDLTILLDAPVEVGLDRMIARGGLDRIEKEGKPFFEAIRRTYLARAKAEPARFVVIDATQTEDAVSGDILAAIESCWSEWQ